MRLCFVVQEGDKEEKVFCFRIKENIQHRVTTGDCLLADTSHGKKKVVAIAHEFETDDYGVMLLMRREGLNALRDIIGQYKYEETIW